jgi:hypothetical protein
LKKIRNIAVLVMAPLAAAAGLLTGPGLASAAPAAPSRAAAVQHAARIHHAGSCTAQGDFATCDAAGNSIRPIRIRVHVHARPDQHVFVAWTDTCSRGTGAGSRSGSFHAVTPVNRLIRHPYAHPDSCIISSDAQLQDSGHWIHVNNTYTR